LFIKTEVSNLMPVKIAYSYFWINTEL